MKNLKYIFTVSLFMVYCAVTAQQEGVLTNFRYHMNAYNPAYVSVEGRTAITSSFRQQWTGVEEAPRTTLVSFGTRLGNKTGLGVSVMHDKTFIEKQTFIGIDYSYQLQLSDKLEMYLGLKAGGDTYSVNAAGLETYNLNSDPSLESISSFNPNIGAGFLLKWESLFFSMALPRMLSSERAENKDGTATAYVSKPHLYTSVGYDVPLSDELILKPATMLRYVSGAPVSLEINSMLSFNGKWELGASYRTDAAFAGLVNISIKEQFILGFAYEVSTRKELAMAKNTNELFLRYVF